jgi:hypothetical protein
MMIEAVRIFEISVNFNVNTRRYDPEDSKLHTIRRENLKSHIKILYAFLQPKKNTVFIITSFVSLPFQRYATRIYNKTQICMLRI